MIQRVSRFKVGLFVLFGVAMALGAVIWLGTMQYFQGGRTYVTFFAESVQGLQKDSVVKYRGVDVGRVEQIRVAPDYKLIEVVMRINLHGEPEKEMVAQLRSVGITGIVFVELDLKKPNEPDFSPELTFAAEYPIIPSKPSEVTKILSMISKVATDIQSIDFKGMSRKLDHIFSVGEKLITDKRLDQTLDNLRHGSQQLKKLLVLANQKLELVQPGKIQDSLMILLEQTIKAAEDARRLLAEASREIKQADLPSTTGEARKLVRRLGGQSDQVMDQLMATMENLRQASQNLQELMRNLRLSPTTVLLAEPPPPREEEGNE